MNLLRNITSVTDVKRDGTNINYIYRETTLIWQRVTSSPLVFNTFYMTAANGYITNSTTDGSSFSFETIPNIQFIRL